MPIAIIFIAIVSVYFFIIAPSGISKAPDISLSIIDGRKLETISLQGSPYLVTFWSTTCSTCIKEMPHLVALYNELNVDGFEIIGIAMPYDPPNMVLKLAEMQNIPYPIALDIQGEALKAFGDINVTPTSFLIDSMGNIVQTKTGVINIEDLRSQIKQLLETPPITIS